MKGLKLSGSLGFRLRVRTIPSSGADIILELIRDGALGLAKNPHKLDHMRLHDRMLVLVVRLFGVQVPQDPLRHPVVGVAALKEPRRRPPVAIRGGRSG